MKFIANSGLPSIFYNFFKYVSLGKYNVIVVGLDQIEITFSYFHSKENNFNLPIFLVLEETHP